MVASRRAANRFMRAHYHRFKMDAAFSEQIYHRYLKTLDFNRIFYTQQDIEKFDAFKSKFHMMYIQGDLRDAYSMFNRLSALRFQRYQYAISLLEKPMQFDVAGDTYQFNREGEPWAKDAQSLNEVWRQRVKNDALSLKMAAKMA